MSDVHQIQALQLIYTNVEVDQSPTRQRGFQIWLCSPELTNDQRRAIAKRLDDFRLPVGANVQTTSLQRHAWFRLDPSWFVIARTVPSLERDKFGRGGKFHAHALIITAEAMRLLNFDPFRVIDGGFAFQSSPAESLSSESWRTGVLPAATVPLSARRATSDRSQPQILSALAAHGDAPEPLPVVVAEPPGALLDRLRDWFANLPAAIRERFSFDTLSSGTMASDRRYLIAGAYSADQLKLWSFRRYHRFDPASGTFTPTLATASTFVEQLFRQSAWCTLDDQERDAVFLLASGLIRGRIEDVKWVPISTASSAVLESCPDADVIRSRLLRMRIQADVPEALAALPRVLAAVDTYLEGSLTDVLPRLAEPIPRQVVDRAIVDELGRSHARPADSVLQALETWMLAGPSSPRTELIVRRWRQSERDIAKIEEFLKTGQEGSARVQWFRGWLQSTLPEKSSQEYARDLPVDQPPSPEKLAAARLHLALGDTYSCQEDLGLALAVALHCGSDRLAKLLEVHGQSPAVVPWVQVAAARRMGRSHTPGWTNDGLGGSFVGFFIRPESRVDETLLDFVAAANSSVGTGFRRMLAESHFGPSPGAESSQRYVIDPLLPKEGSQHYQAVLAADAKMLPRAVEAFRGYLEAASDECFAACANTLLQQVYGVGVVRELSEDVYFAGLKLHWIQRTNVERQSGLFEAIAGSVVTDIDYGNATGIDPARWRGSNQRLKWLMARLENPTATQHMRL